MDRPPHKPRYIGIICHVNGTTPHTALTGEEIYLSNLCTFEWYEWCYFREQKMSFPFNKEVLGCILGPTKGEGNEMAQWVMKGNANVVPHQTSRSLNVAELNSETKIRSHKNFNLMIERRWGLPIYPSSETTPNNWDPYEDNEDDEDDDEIAKPLPEVDETVDANDTLIDQQPAYDRIINAEVQLHHQDHLTTGKVKRRALGPNGKTAGSYHDNPILNSTVYEVKFPDGKIKEYVTNAIAKNMLTQVDFEGFTMTMIEGIIGHVRDKKTAVHMKGK
eukprot:9612311-Ditylum_brightwellii.AAC.1